ncbi:phosphoribosylanthranilate isomerase [Methanobacterium spitsbergense]|uniref:N-(5'-phosphoribosyl)anthranilate isomerase n=1 Tax=Methanobacterium spitsbergense TaxID=2874285 RepID=A0A8T5UP20_9EURY|nr:phosphoribosylanthranilate isomerase [Methanobacterium spitsbergense]MBZ2165732.1 phosphoribosylanthranilate isomerase [Methanobacterium spitsbergense]
MKIKICGITRFEDVSKCEESGANLIGFINIKRSKRFVTLQEIKTLVSSMKDKNKAVLVLEPDNPEEVIMKMKKTGIRIVQLHSLSKNQIKYLKWIEGFQRTLLERNITVIRAIGISNESLEMKDDELKFSSSKVKEIENFAKICDALLFDYQVKGKSGGTGLQIPTKMVLKAVKISKNVNHDIKIFLAGGMNSERIKNDIELQENVLDYFDVNSGVEDKPGIKNPELVDELMEIRAKI